MQRITLKDIVKFFLPYGIWWGWKKWDWKKYEQAVRYFFNNKLSEKYINGIDAPENCVLLIEITGEHGETLPGLAKYALDLAYRVDVVMAVSANRGKSALSRNEVGVFSRFKSDRLRLFTLPSQYVPHFLRRKANKYRHIIINTYRDWMLESINLFELRPVCLLHTEYTFKNEYGYTNKIITLVNMDCFGRKQPTVVNGHYFGDFISHEKSDIICFAAFGITYTQGNGSRVRDVNLIIKICEYLKNKNIKNYKIKIIGDNDFIVPNEYKDKIQSLGFLSFPEMYEVIEKSDFILALISPASVEYTNQASGTYQLSYGFLKPVLIHKKFAEIGKFTEKNSIIYDDIYPAMEKAIGISAKDYSAMVEHLEITAQSIYKNSLNNLKYVLEADIQLSK